VQLFQIRAGRLVGRLGFVADAQSGSPGAILQRVLEEHYQTVDAVEIPAEIMVQHELPEGDMLAEFLSQTKGRKVAIVTPQRQVKAEMIEMVERNAGYELARTQRFADRNAQAMLTLPLSWIYPTYRVALKATTFSISRVPMLLRRRLSL
jgi:excinuclease ABC subunit C